MSTPKNWFDVVKPIDVTKVSRSPETVCSTVTFKDQYFFHRGRSYELPVDFVWIKGGMSCLNDRRFGMRYENAVDDEGDSAWILSIPIIGLKFICLDGGVSFFEGFVGVDFNSFNLSADPEEAAKALTAAATYRRGEIIRPSVRYSPTSNIEFFEHVMGKKVEIRVGPRSSFS